MSVIDPRNVVLTETINFRLDAETRDAIDKWAGQENRKRSDMARVLIEEALAARAKRAERRVQHDHVPAEP